jgi:hypothetical protein
MWELLGPIVFAATVTGIVYYLVEILMPYSEAIIQFEKSCADKGGMVYEERNKPKLCIKKEIIKIE